VFKINAVIFYFSGTGNTWWVAQKIASKLVERNIPTKVFSLENEQIKDQATLEKKISSADLVGIGYPIYASDYPVIVGEFIKALPEGRNKKAFVFTTMMAFSGDGAMVAVRSLRRKGYKVKQAVNIKMMNNLRLPYPIVRSLQIKNGEETKELKQKAEERIERLVERIIAEKHWLQGRDPFNIAGGLMQRIPMKLLKHSFFARYFFVDKETCNKCMQCVDFCPTKNITYDGGEFHFGNKCIACFRCYNLCPQEAIQHKKGTLNRQRFPRYKGPGNGFRIEKIRE